MPLLADYAITPDVFDVTSYSDEEVGRLHLRGISEVMKSEGLVRDLRSGEWRRLFSEDERPWHRTGKELVKKLFSQGRLVDFQPALPAAPSVDEDWCEEAIATHRSQPLTGGIIVTGRVKEAFRSQALVERIDKLDRAPWWQNRSPSVRLPRNLPAYQQHLGPILRCANSLYFIDPHLDPARYQYRDLGNLLVSAGNRRPAPLIEIHRVCYEGSGRNRGLLGIDELEQDFRQKLAAPLSAAGLKVDVFVWDDFHDRFLISNLIGISLPNGFDTTSNQAAVTTWTRLGKRESDDVQREFDPANNRHKLHGTFRIP